MWTVEFAQAAIRDFKLIFDHLQKSYQDLGDDNDTAFDRAELRVLDIQSSANDLAKAPLQGTLRPDILTGLRSVGQRGAVYWFVADEPRQTIRVLAVFYGGQDHILHMLTLLLNKLPE